jgi:16S rRNA (cytosine967-C5)-methyltransferase
MRPATVRATVVDVFTRVHDGKELADRALDRSIRAQPSLHSTERRLVSEAVYAMVRHVRTLDFLLEKTLGAKLSSIATPDLHKLRFALALARETGRGVAEAVNLAGLDARAAAAVETAAKGEVEWPSDPVQRLAVRRSVPDWIAQKLHAQYGDQADALLEALNARAPLTLRANLLAGTRDELAASLKTEKVEAKPGALSPWALTLEGRPNVFGLEAYRKGRFELQDEGSQLIALATHAKAGHTVIDACAGGGGKTLALAAMMRNKGRLVACDVSEKRLEDIPQRAKRAQAFCLQPTVVATDESGDKVLSTLARRADVVLVDAPCSGTGSWRRNPDARWRMSATEAEAFPATQLAIVRRYAKTLKPGGLMIYATCSVLREENEAVVDALLEEGLFEEEPVDVPLAARDENGRLKLLPHVHGTDGFFAAALRLKK